MGVHTNFDPGGHDFTGVGQEIARILRDEYRRDSNIEEEEVEFFVRDPQPVELALFEQRLQTEKAKTEKAQIEAESDRLDLEEKRAMVNLTRASNFRNRVFDFTTVVTEQSVEDILQAVGRWHRQEPGRPITVRFTSPGGDVMAGLSLFDSLRMIISDGTPIKTITTGQAASMAAVLLQAGTERIVAPNAYFLIHEVSESGVKLIINESVSEKEEKAAFLKRLNETLYAILAERSTLTKTEIARKAKKTDWWLNAEDCVRYGFADKILKTSYKPGR